MTLSVIRGLRRLDSLWTGPALFVVLLAAFMILNQMDAFAQSAGNSSPAQQTAASCSFGINFGQGIVRIVAGALIGLAFMAVAIAAVFNRAHSSGGGGGSALMGVVIGGIDLGGALFLGLGAFGFFAAIVITAIGLTPCP